MSTSPIDHVTRIMELTNQRDQFMDKHENFTFRAEVNEHFDQEIDAEFQKLEKYYTEGS